MPAPARLDDRPLVDDPTPVAFGFTRLRILDLTDAAAQPMMVPGQAALIFNGEIYNYIELRGELEARGWRFTSRGDTEVLLKGYLEWGVDVLPRMNGMWALALYDLNSHQLLLSRDRFGEKPLFWSRWGGGVAFASEVKQLACFPDLPIRLDTRRTAGYLLTGRPYEGTSSWFEGIYQVEPGGWLRIDEAAVRSGSYYDLETETGKIEPERRAVDWAGRFADTFAESVRIRLRSDVPVGTSLSSGVDSSAVLAQAVALGHDRYHAFSFGGDDPGIDERARARRFAHERGAIWHGVSASAEEFHSSWDAITFQQECPLPSTSLFGQWKVFEAARSKGIVVILDGQGADELLAGYPKLMVAAARSSLGSPTGVARALLAFSRQVGAMSTLRTAGYRYIGRFGNTPDPSRWVLPGLWDGDRVPDLRHGLRTAQIEDLRRWSLPNLLSYADRNSMAHSIECRLPYLDPRLVALALAMPADVLMHGGWAKWPLRWTLAKRGGKVPAWRIGKRWFGVPQSAWLRGPLAPVLKEWLLAPHPAWESFVDLAELRRFVHDDWSRRPSSHGSDDQVFQMLSLERFLRVWFAV